MPFDAIIAFGTGNFVKVTAPGDAIHAYDLRKLVVAEDVQKFKAATRFNIYFHGGDGGERVLADTITAASMPAGLYLKFDDPGAFGWCGEWPRVGRLVGGEEATAHTDWRSRPVVGERDLRMCTHAPCALPFTHTRQPPAAAMPLLPSSAPLSIAGDGGGDEGGE